jgi:hypothetical protein
VTEDDRFENRHIYRGGDPDSHEAYFGIDVTVDESRNELVTIETFNWDVKHSNDCVRGKSETGSGKGEFFSFYLARKAFLDPDRINASKIIKSENAVIAAEVVPDRYDLPIIVVIHTDGKHIVTARCEVDKSDLRVTHAYYKRKYGIDEKLDRRKIERTLPRRAVEQIEKGLEVKRLAKEEAVEAKALQVVENGKKFREFVLALRNRT